MTGNASKRRLFVGTFLDACQQEEVGKLALHKEELKTFWKHEIKFVKPAKLHLTWIFLGHLEEGVIPNLVTGLEAATQRQAPMEISFDKPEFWPSAKKPRQLVLVSSAVPEPVMTLAAEVRKHLGSFCEKKEDRPYKPHITLLRFAMGSKSQSPLALPEWFKPDLPLALKINKIALIESHLGQASEEYVTLNEFAL